MNAGIATAIAVAVMVLSNGIVGVSLLRTAARTRRAPELLIGLGLVTMGPVSQVFTALSGTGRVPAGEVQLAFHSLSAVGSAIGMACVYYFVWTVFRPGVAWARIAAGAAIALLVAATAWSISAMATAAPETPSREVIRGPGLAILVLFTLAFAWAALEAARHWSAARKRLRLGLSEAAVTNRFLLWTIACGSAFLLGLGLIRFQVQGQQITGSLVPSLITMVVSVVTGASMYLAFLPPRAYLAWVERRASRAV